MEPLWSWGNDLIVALQTAAWLQPVMQFASFLGTEEFFLLLMPALLWAWNERLGRRLAVLLIASNGLGNIFKVVVSHPRPYWIDARIKALSVETSFGLPSTHAMVGLTVWGFLAQQALPARRAIAWAIAGVVIFMISLSRLFLGMHFPTDVLGGWVIGIAALWAFLRWEAPVAAWLGRLGLAAQIGLSFGVSIVFLAVVLGVIAAKGDIPELAEWTTNAAAAYPLDLEVEPISPRSPDAPVNTAGMLFGLGAGLACSARWARFNAGGTWLKRGARYLIGLVGVLLFWRGLALIFPTDPLAVGIAFRYVRYALVVFWALFGAPCLFLRLGLAEHRDDLR